MRYFFGLFLLQLFTIAAVAQSKIKSVVQFSDSVQAAGLLGAQDAFTNAWSAFDIQARLGNATGDKLELLQFCKSQARNWTQQEVETLGAVLEFLDKQVEKLEWHLPLSEPLIFVKSTGLEEGGTTCYARAHYIVIKALDTNPDLEMLAAVIARELFHVLAFRNPKMRMDLYAIIGFKQIRSIAYPNSIKHLRITTSGTLSTDAFITLLHEGNKVDCLMLQYAGEPYVGGNSTQYLQVGFFILSEGHHKEVVLEAGAPVIYNLQDVIGFFEQVGLNSRYNIHPQEILAANFLTALRRTSLVPDPQIVQQISSYFQKQ